MGGVEDWSRKLKRRLAYPHDHPWKCIIKDGLGLELTWFNASVGFSDRKRSGLRRDLRSRFDTWSYDFWIH